MTWKSLVDEDGIALVRREANGVAEVKEDLTGRGNLAGVQDEKLKVASCRLANEGEEA